MVTKSSKTAATPAPNKAVKRPIKLAAQAANPAVNSNATKKPAAAPASKAAKVPAPAKATKVTAPAKAAKPSVSASKSAAAPAQKPIDKTRVKLVRDSFTMPEADFALIEQLKTRAMAGKRQAKKSELLRAGLQALAALAPAQLLKALDALAPVKTGRPKKGH